jgi:hypothetical protein
MTEVRQQQVSDALFAHIFAELSVTSWVSPEGAEHKLRLKVNVKLTSAYTGQVEVRPLPCAPHVRG